MRSISRVQAADACGQSRFCPQGALFTQRGMDEALAFPLAGRQGSMPAAGRMYAGTLYSAVCLIDDQDDRLTPEENSCA